MMGWLRTLANRDEGTGALGRHGALLATLVLLLVALPVGQMIMGGTPHFPLLLALVLLAAVFVNSRQRWIFGVAVVVGIGAVLGTLIGDYTGSPSARVTSELLGIGLLGFTSLVMLNSLMRTDDVSTDTIVGGICVYLLVGLCFALSFTLMTELVPGSFSRGEEPIVRELAATSRHRTQLLYFSFVTLTTLGYGDITPTTDLAQMLAVTEGVIGQLYLTIFVARLVALYVGFGHRRVG